MLRRIAFGFVVALCAVTFTGGTPVVKAEDKKEEVKLEGKITCAKCDLKVAEKCTTVIVVKEKEKDVTYYLDADAHKKYHGDICKTPTDGWVKGTTKKDGEKMIVTVKELEYKKK